MSNNLYNEESIKSLSPLEFTRLRPGVYCGSTEYATQPLIEIVSNAIDEYKAGHGDTIDVTINKDNSCCVRDYAQGFLINSKRDDGKTILQAAFDTLNTSGKFTDDGVYEGTALGLNGIGSKLTNFLSHWLIVTSFRDGKFEEVSFKEGVFSDRITGDSNEHGTEVEWLPSEEFFTSNKVEINRVKELFDVLVCLCPGLTINLTTSDEKVSFFSKNGLNDLVDKKVKDNELINNRMNMSFENGRNKMDMVITYTSNYSLNMISYVNTGETDAGPHITQIKTILTREFNKFFKEKKWLKDKDTNFSGDDIQEGLLIAFNITAPGVSYDAQTKSRIVKLDMTPFTSAIVENLQYWFNNNEKEIKLIFDKAASARKAREAAKKAREAARKPKEKGLKAKMKLSNKFIDCANKNPSERNLLLVEGLSAGSAAVEARNAKTDCIYMLRGKIISPLKTSIDKILANQEMSDIVRVIGAGFGDTFDVSKMNFDKIVITTDMDSDGADIELLLITFFFTYMRPLIEAGKLYRAVTPLYIVKLGKEELYFYTEEEMDKFKTTHKNNYEVLRAKGLGELDAADLHKVCFEKQRFKRITISDLQKTKVLLDTLQGQAVTPRKQFIYDNAKTLGFEFD
jgi:DNA gyrase/topoisomerase IV subunit B